MSDSEMYLLRHHCGLPGCTYRSYESDSVDIHRMTCPGRVVRPTYAQMRDVLNRRIQAAQENAGYFIGQPGEEDDRNVDDLVEFINGPDPEPVDVQQDEPEPVLDAAVPNVPNILLSSSDDEESLTSNIYDLAIGSRYYILSDEQSPPFAQPGVYARTHGVHAQTFGRHAQTDGRAAQTGGRAAQTVGRAAQTVGRAAQTVDRPACPALTRATTIWPSTVGRAYAEGFRGKGTGLGFIGYARGRTSPHPYPASPVSAPAPQISVGSSAQTVGRPAAQTVVRSAAQTVGRPAAQMVGRPAQIVGRPAYTRVTTIWPSTVGRAYAEGFRGKGTGPGFIGYARGRTSPHPYPASPVSAPAPQIRLGSSGYAQSRGVSPQSRGVSPHCRVRKYTKEFLLRFRYQCNNLPPDFEVPPDLQKELILLGPIPFRMASIPFRAALLPHSVPSSSVSVPSSSVSVPSSSVSVPSSSVSVPSSSVSVPSSSVSVPTSSVSVPSSSVSVPSSSLQLSPNANLTFRPRGEALLFELWSSQNDPMFGSYVEIAMAAAEGNVERAVELLKAYDVEFAFKAGRNDLSTSVEILRTLAMGIPKSHFESAIGAASDDLKSALQKLRSHYDVMQNLVEMEFEEKYALAAIVLSDGSLDGSLSYLKKIENRFA